MYHPHEAIADQLFTFLRNTAALQLRTPQEELVMDRSCYVILSLLDGQGPQRLGRVAAEFRLDPSTITRQVQSVVQRGYAEKTPDPSDRRASILSLTPRGREAVRAAREARLEFLDELLADWTAAEREEFLHALKRFNATTGRWLDSSQQPS